MKLTKKLIAVLLAALMLVTVFPVAFAEGEPAMAYTIADGVLTCSGTGAMPSYQYQDRPWANAEDEAQVLEATSIVVEGFTTVGAYAFKDLKKVTTVTLADTVEDIDMYAFSGCEALTSITLPETMTAVNRGTFSGCKALEGITVPNQVETIVSYAFSGSGLKEIFLPLSVKKIEKYAFANCEALKKVTIKNTKCDIVDGAFPPPPVEGSDEEPLTIYAVYNSAGDNYAIAKGYPSVHIPDEDKPDLGTPETIQEVLHVSEQNMKETKIGAFLRRLFELLGLSKKDEVVTDENADNADNGASTLNITGPGAFLGNFLMKSSFAGVILKLRETFQKYFKTLSF